MKFRILLLISVIAAFLGIMPVQAQSKLASLPLFLNLGDTISPPTSDLYSWNDGLQKRTSYGHNAIPIASPDGRWVAYRSLPQIYVDLSTNDNPYPPPSNIWVLNPATNKAEKIADQPANSGIDPTVSALILRTDPSWSPSGRQLAWTEIVADGTKGKNTDLLIEQLVVYDLDARQSRVIVSKLPEHRTTDKYPVQSDVAWGLPGIAIVTHGYSLKEFPEQITIYDPNGVQLVQSEILNNTEFSNSQAIWIEDRGTFWLTNVTGDVYINPVTGSKTFMDNLTPEAYSPLNPSGVSLYYGNKVVGEGNPVWLLAYNGVVKTEMASAGRYYNVSGFAIAPDGKRAAYIVYPGQGTEGGMYVFRNGSKVRLDYGNVLGVSWGPIAWRFHSNWDNGNG